jgi:hypothetical protein
VDPALSATLVRMRHPEQPFTPLDDALLPAYAHHYTIKAVCACGHEREIYARPIQQQLEAGVAIGRVRDALRCHNCQARRPTIWVCREPR